MQRFRYNEEEDNNNYISMVETTLMAEINENGFAKRKDYLELLNKKFFHIDDFNKKVLDNICNKNNYIATKQYNKETYPNMHNCYLIIKK